MVAVCVTEALDIFFDGYGIAEVIIHVPAIKTRSSSKARVINHDTMNKRIAIGCCQRRLEVHLVNFPYFKFDTVGLTSFSSPL
jgi:hypothetical protein